MSIPSSPVTRVRVILAALSFLVAVPGRADDQAASSAGQPTSFAGTWKLAPKISDDVQSRIEAATGSANLSGAGGIGGVGLLPKQSTKKDVERVELRQFLLDYMGLLADLEIEQTPGEIKLIRGDDVRIFYFDREHVRSDFQGRKLRCRTRWQGSQLVIEEQGEADKTRIIDMLTLVPSRNQLIHAIRVETNTLEKPLEVSLAYDKVTR